MAKCSVFCCKVFLGFILGREQDGLWRSAWWASWMQQHVQCSPVSGWQGALHFGSSLCHEVLINKVHVFLLDFVWLFTLFQIWLDVCRSLWFCVCVHAFTCVCIHMCVCVRVQLCTCLCANRKKCNPTNFWASVPLCILGFNFFL